MEYEGRNPNNNRGARGRIAEVLAEARASLKEPTRPFTPASLDARTSIDLKALDKFGRIAMTKNPSYGRLPDDYYPSSSSSRTQSFEDLDNNNEVSMMKSKRRANRKENTSSNAFSAPPSLSSIAGEVMLAIFKLKETLAPQDDFMVDDEDASGGGLKLYNSASLQEICLRSAEPIEKISKYLVSKHEDEGMGSDIVDVAFDYARTVFNRGLDREECTVTRDLASRLVLRLFTSLLSKIDSIMSTKESNKGSFLSSTRYQPMNVVGVLLQTIKTMYRIHTETTKAAVIAARATPKSKSLSGLTQNNQKDRNEGIKTKESRALVLYLDTLHIDLNDAVLRQSLDLLLEFQSTLTTQLQGFVISLVDNLSSGSGYGKNVGITTARGVSSSRDNSFLVSSSYAGGVSSNNNSFLRGSTESLRGSTESLRETLRESLSFRESKDYERDNDISLRDNIRDNIRDSLRDNVRQSITSISNKPIDRTYESDVETLYDLLDCAAVVGALFRSHSTDEIGRRRLVHMGIIDRIAETLRVVGATAIALGKYKTNWPQQQQQQHQQQQLQQQQSGNVSTVSPPPPPPPLFDNLTSKLALIAAQLVVVVRNTALDSTGRAAVLSSKTVCLLCSLLRPFRGYPDLVLNCLRVTAKLSLQEPFRSQINSKTNHIKCLVEVLVLEGTHCQHVMNGDDEHSMESLQTNMYPSSSDPLLVSNGNGTRAKESNNNNNDNNDNDNAQLAKKWPFWYTWPLLSRVAFTLGNLTTSNGSNRALIGMDCKALSPLLSLLQACGGSLMQLRNERDRENTKTIDGIEDGGRGKAGSQREAEAKNHDEFQEDDEEEEEGEEEDEDDEQDQAFEQELMYATIKLLRLLANVSIDEGVGQTLASNSETIQMLVELVAYASSLPSTEEDTRGPGSFPGGSTRRGGGGIASSDQEELLLNTVATATNVTYYSCHAGLQPNPPSSSSSSSSSSTLRNSANGIGGSNGNNNIHSPTRTTAQRQAEKHSRQLVTLCRQLTRCLFHENEEIVLEAARALGNLTRNRDVTRYLIKSRGDEALLILLGHTSGEIVSAVTGALVNLSADPTWRQAHGQGLGPGPGPAHGPRIDPSSDPTNHSMPKTNPFPPLLAVLRRAAMKDLRLSTLICQVIHNLLLDDDQDDTDHTTNLDINGGVRISQPQPTSSSSSSSPSPSKYNQRTTSTKRMMEVPSLLAPTIAELVDCADDLAVTFASLTGEKGEQLHIFMAPQVRTTNENVRKYTDFATIGKAVLSQISRCVLVDSYDRTNVGVGAGNGKNGNTRYVGK